MIPQFKKYKSLGLLVSLVILFLAFPVFDLFEAGHLIFPLIFASTLLSGVYAISDNKKYAHRGIMLAAPIFLCLFANIIFKNSILDLAARIFGVIFMSYMAYALLKRVLTQADAGMDEVYGAIAAYALIGIIFGMIYFLIEREMPGSFNLNGATVHAASFIYFSFTVLSTTGFGDITPAIPLTRTLSVIEMVIGVLYVAVLIGRLIGISQANRR